MTVRTENAIDATLATLVDRAVADLIGGALDMDAIARNTEWGGPVHQDTYRDALARLVEHVRPRDLPRGAPSALWWAIRCLHRAGTPLTGSAVVAKATEHVSSGVLQRKLDDVEKWGLGGLAAIPAAERLLTYRKLKEEASKLQGDLADVHAQFPRVFDGTSVFL